MFKFCISFHKILKLLFFFFFGSNYCCCTFMKCCFIYITVVPSVSTQSWGLTEWAEILENSQIAWILELALLPLFFMWSIQHLIMCHQSPLVFLLLTHKFNKIFCKFQERKDLPGFQNYIYSGAHLKSLSCAPLWNCCYPVLVLVWMQTFCSLLYAFSLVLKILNTFIPILIFQILLSCNCYK